MIKFIFWILYLKAKMRRVTYFFLQDYKNIQNNKIQQKNI